QSVNGSPVTIIQGAWDPSTTNGPLAVRCAWLTNGAALNGFTLRGGATRGITNGPTQINGGGAWCASTNVVLANCLISSNIAARSGGGVFQATLNNCILGANGTISPGPSFGPSEEGGGADFSNLKNCLITGNFA